MNKPEPTISKAELDKAIDLAKGEWWFENVFHNREFQFVKRLDEIDDFISDAIEDLWDESDIIDEVEEMLEDIVPSEIFDNIDEARNTLMRRYKEDIRDGIDNNSEYWGSDDEDGEDVDDDDWDDADW